jgi:monothiol glutaredoxin
MEASTRDRIRTLIEGDDVVLFMKGTPQAPRCGFSAQVTQILDTLGVPYRGVDVLADAEIREGIKAYSDWPTIPQLYVRREFVGGCDIVKEMYGSGELESKLGVAASAVEPPAITVTQAAAEALRAALDSPDDFVRLEIDARFEHGLSISPRQPKDVVVQAAGVTFVMDRAAAKRAPGLTIAFVESPTGKAFKIENPNAPPRVRQITPRELAERLANNPGLELLDVRTPAERERAHLPTAKLLDRAEQDRIRELPKDTELVFYCHHGGRSLQAAEFFLSQGFRNVMNLAGGIDAWSVEIDPSVPRY